VREDRTGLAGFGVQVTSAGSFSKGVVEMHGCFLSNNAEVGLVISGSDVTADALVVRGVERLRRVGADVTLLFQSALTISDSLIADNATVGVLGIGASVSLTRTNVTGTTPHDDGTFGDGVALDGSGSLTLDQCRVRGNARAGVAAFNSAVKMTASTLGCKRLRSRRGRRVRLRSRHADGVRVRREERRMPGP